MIKSFIASFAILMNCAVLADSYQAPKLELNDRLKQRSPNFKVHKERHYDGLKVHQYKVKENPENPRDLASEDKEGRLPSSQVQQEDAPAKVEHWTLDPKSL